MILLGAHAGLRVSEIAAIRGEHVDLITCTIAITGKGEKNRYIPLHPVLQLLARGMPPREWWFPSWVGNCQHAAGGPVLGNSVSACVSKAMDRAGVPGRIQAVIATQSFPANRRILPPVSATRASCGDDR